MIKDLSIPLELLLSLSFSSILTVVLLFVNLFQRDLEAKMCMLFIRCNNECSKDEFALVVLSIRDEFFMRPTKLCHFWKDSTPDIIGGMDLEDGREGGTWLAMNTRGQLGVLLNILQPLDQLIPGKKHRGFLVPQYLKSGLPGPQFLESIIPYSRDHADYLMVTIDFALRSQSLVSFYSNMGGQMTPVVLPCTGRGDNTFAFGNSLPHKPWVKTIVGRKMFENITHRNRQTWKKKRLIAELFHLANDPFPFYPDEQLMNDGRGYDEEYLKGLSAINVQIPSLGFGSRTQSIILVDSLGRVTFVERTIGPESLDMSLIQSTQIRWPKRTFSFRLDQPSSSRSSIVPIYSLSSRL